MLTILILLRMFWILEMEYPLAITLCLGCSLECSLGCRLECSFNYCDHKVSTLYLQLLLLERAMGLFIKQWAYL